MSGDEQETLTEWLTKAWHTEGADPAGLCGNQVQLKVIDKSSKLEFLLCVCVCVTGCYSTAQAAFEFEILLVWSPKCSDFRPVSYIP